MSHPLAPCAHHQQLHWHWGAVRGPLPTRLKLHFGCLLWGRCLTLTIETSLSPTPGPLAACPHPPTPNPCWLPSSACTWASCTGPACWLQVIGALCGGHWWGPKWLGGRLLAPGSPRACGCPPAKAPGAAAWGQLCCCGPPPPTAAAPANKNKGFVLRFKLWSVYFDFRKIVRSSIAGI